MSLKQVLQLSKTSFLNNTPTAQIVFKTNEIMALCHWGVKQGGTKTGRSTTEESATVWLVSWTLWQPRTATRGEKRLWSSDLIPTCVKACSHCNVHQNVHQAESNSMRAECAMIAFTLLFEIRGRWQVRNNDCTTRVRVKSYADAVVYCSVLNWLFNCAQLCLKYWRDNRRRE